MPANYFQPLDSLRSLPGSGFRPTQVKTGYGAGDEDSPEAALMALQDQRRSELLANAGKGLAMAAPQNTLSELNSDIQSNPLTQQGADVKDYLGKTREANLSGFGSPQEAAGYEQRLSEEKLRQPMEVEKLKGQFGLQGQELQNKGALEVEQERTRGYGARNDVALLKQFLANQGRQDVSDTDNIQQTLANLDKMHSIGVGGRRLSDTDYQTQRQYWLNQLKSSGGQQSVQSSPTDDARTLMQNHPEIANYPGSKINYLIKIAESELPGFDSRVDGQQLIQELNKLGLQ